jgi:hypothetical protein
MVKLLHLKGQKFSLSNSFCSSVDAKVRQHVKFPEMGEVKSQLNPGMLPIIKFKFFNFISPV